MLFAHCYLLFELRMGDFLWGMLTGMGIALVMAAVMLLVSVIGEQRKKTARERSRVRRELGGDSFRRYSK